MDNALIWINKFKIKVINIEENYDLGGRWVEEQRGSTITIFYETDTKTYQDILAYDEHLENREKIKALRLKKGLKFGRKNA